MLTAYVGATPVAAKRTHAPKMRIEIMLLGSDKHTVRVTLL
jgi:hypothetical protein